MKCVTIKYKGHEVLCYGTIREDSDIDLVAINNCGDLVENYIDNWNFETDKPYKSFKSLVKDLIDTNNFQSIEQIEATN